MIRKGRFRGDIRVKIVKSIIPLYEGNEIMQFDETNAELWHTVDR